MAEETVSSQEIPPAADKAGDIDSNAVSILNIEDDTLFSFQTREDNVKQMEKRGETSLVGEFMKIEKESVDARDRSHTAENNADAGGRPTPANRPAGDPEATRELLHSLERVERLQGELQRISLVLKERESENEHLKDDLLLTKEKHQETVKKHEELVLDHKKLCRQKLEAEERHSMQLKTLQESFLARDQDKNKELSRVKEALDDLSLELEMSRKKREGLELELQRATVEARKFEELHRQSGLHAESETKRALEFERLLELAKSGAEDMENQSASLQDELKSFQEKMADSEKVKELLKSTTAELSEVRGQLELSKSQELKVEQKLALREDHVKELSQELELARASESRTKEDTASLENLLASTRQDLEQKVSQLEDVNQRLEEQVSSKGGVAEQLKSHPTKMKIIEEELAKVIKEKEALEEAVKDLTSYSAHMKELCNDLEAKLKQSDENLCTADTCLAQAVADRKGLEQKLKSLEELRAESGHAVSTANQKNLELEDMLKALNAAAEEAKSQLRESETRCIEAEQTTTELKQQLNVEQLKRQDYQRELKELSDKISDLNTTLKKEVEEKQKLGTQLQESQVRLAQMESELGMSTARTSELETELKSATDKCAEHEGRANTVHQRSLELENLIQASDSKAENDGKKVSELELLLETEKYRSKELEEHINLLEKECKNVETESLKSLKHVSELQARLEVVRSNASNLEAALQASAEKEKELTECLSLATEENRNLKEASKTSNEKLSEAENLVDILQNELSISQKGLETVETDLKAAGMKENEVTEKLKIVEEKLEQQREVLERATARSAEFESTHETLTTDSEIKLQEVITNFTNRDSEARALHEKVNVLEDQVNSFQEQLAGANERYETAKKELDQILVKLCFSEDANEDLKRKISEAEGTAEKYAAENGMLSESNALLSGKISDLEEKLTAAVSEMEVSNRQLASHMNTITKLTERHSKVSELLRAAEARVSEAELELEEAIHKISLRDSEAKVQYEKLKVFEVQVKTDEERVQEELKLVKSQGLELEQALLNYRDLEGELEKTSGQFEKETRALVDTNSKLTKELTLYESKVSELQTKLSIISCEKHDTTEEINSARKEIEELRQRLASEGQKPQSQISTVMEENKLLNETFGSSNKDLETRILSLKEQLKEQKSNDDALKTKLKTLNSEVGQKAELQKQLKDLEVELATAEARIKEEKDSSPQKVTGQEASLKHSFEELEAKKNEVLLLETRVRELKQKLQQADAKLKDKEVGATATEAPKAEVIKFRGIESFTSTPKRKHKKKSEQISAQALPSDTTLVRNTNASPIIALKLIFGIALVSVVFGIILGKRY